MKAICMVARRALEEGDEAALRPLRRHLDECPACRAHAALLDTLAAAEPRDADEEQVQEILQSLPVARWQRRRAVTWLPAVAGLFLVLAGLLLLGGVPAGGAVAALPGALTALGGLIGTASVDALAILRGGSAAIRSLISAGGVWLVVWLLLAALAGGWGVLALARSHRRGR